MLALLGSDLMSRGLRGQPATQRGSNGGIPARRALIRRGVRLLRREWRQQLLILALITVTVAATVVGSAVAIATPTASTAAFGGYLAAIGFFMTNRLDQLSELQSIPVTGLLWIPVGMPLIAVGVSWVLAVREPPAISRQPLE
jgi:hypothetical protein